MRDPYTNWLCVESVAWKLHGFKDLFLFVITIFESRIYFSKYICYFLKVMMEKVLRIFPIEGWWEIGGWLAFLNSRSHCYLVCSGMLDATCSAVSLPFTTGMLHSIKSSYLKSKRKYTIFIEKCRIMCKQKKR